jgi:hypothetical protein
MEAANESYLAGGALLMSSAHEGKHASTILWVTASLILLTFVFLDAGALAWSASVISGSQLTAEIFTFFVVLSGAGVTVWRMTGRN